jgi:hypothetical protein
MQNAGKYSAKKVRLQGQDGRGGGGEKQMPQEVINLNGYCSYAECEVVHVPTFLSAVYLSYSREVTHGLVNLYSTKYWRRLCHYATNAE